jgi:hypothetical protein
MNYFVLGDSSLLLQMDSKTEHICDNRLQQIGLNIRSTLISLLKSGCGYDDRHVREQKQALVQLQNRWRNQVNGFYIASLDPNVADHAYVGERQLRSDDNWNIALMSDGLSRLMDTFQSIPSADAFIDYLTRTPAQEVINRIRMIENTDPNGQIYPRFRKHDDVSMLLIQNREGVSPCQS